MTQVRQNLPTLFLPRDALLPQPKPALSQLPWELLLNICLFATPEDCLILSLTCKTFQSFLDSSDLWEKRVGCSMAIFRVRKNALRTVKKAWEEFFRHMGSAARSLDSIGGCTLPFKLPRL